MSALVVDRWVNLEGPAPQGVRELLDAACGVPGMTPELEERLDRRVHEALAADRRRRARQRNLKRALGGGILAASLGTAMVLALRSAALPDATTAREVAPSVVEPISTRLAGAETPALPPLVRAPLPALSTSSRPPDKAPVRRPRKGSGAGPLRP